MLSEDYKQNAIASKIGVDASTVSREISKRSTPNGYFADIAQLNYEYERKKCGAVAKLKYNRVLQRYIVRRLRKGWSPEQISGRMKYEQLEETVCTETIYIWLYTDEYALEKGYYEYLTHKKRKRKKRSPHYSKRKSRIPNRVSIHKRPAEAATRKEIGHWEADSVLFTHKRAITTMNELKSGFVVFEKIEQKTSDLTAKALINGLKEYYVTTLTVDNGSEFVKHEEVNKTLTIQTYFADPYSSWQRGANENANMLLRRYLPKRTNIENLSQEELNDIASEMNNRPRKRLGFQTPLEVYTDNLSKLKSNVALDSRM